MAPPKLRIARSRLSAKPKLKPAKPAKPSKPSNPSKPCFSLNIYLENHIPVQLPKTQILVLRCVDENLVQVPRDVFFDAFPATAALQTYPSIIHLSHPSETSLTLTHIRHLLEHHTLPFLPPFSPATRTPPEGSLISSLTSIARFIGRYGTKSIRDYALVAVRRPAAWREVSPLVPFVFGAIVDDIHTCSWALGIARWRWDSPGFGTIEEDGDEDEDATESEAELEEEGMKYGLAGRDTLDPRSWPFGVDRVVPSPYRWALGRACAELEGVNEKSAGWLVNRFEALLGEAKAHEACIVARL